ncbi:uncharacterized protein LOC125038253 isoform X2 [Penaeus chinensis]|uniref:uncharacterized protein LOC125038253 isoform X2 n=1 Tax=Penaeus chinensis TaxID=139456 RepID=UPI001FB71A03|nr:uncharacterized protein LOC125038253 isoform X2 [Penaeus chinensis]
MGNKRAGVLVTLLVVCLLVMEAVSLPRKALLGLLVLSVSALQVDAHHDVIQSGPPMRPRDPLVKERGGPMMQDYLAVYPRGSAMMPNDLTTTAGRAPMK